MIGCTAIDLDLFSSKPKWRNWQTRRIQNPVRATSCGFKSHLRYLLSDKDLGPVFLSSFSLARSGLIFESVADRWFWVGVPSRESSPDAT